MKDHQKNEWYDHTPPETWWESVLAGICLVGTIASLYAILFMVSP